MPVLIKSEINAMPPGLSTRAISRHAWARSSASGMLWMQRFESTTSKLASGKLSLRASSLLRSTLSCTPSTSTLACVRSSEFPERSLVLQTSMPVPVPVVSRRAAPMAQQQTAPSAYVKDSFVAAPAEHVEHHVTMEKLAPLGIQQHQDAAGKDTLPLYLNALWLQRIVTLPR